MLQIEVPAGEFFDEASNEFVNTKPCVLHLEHSLVSLAKWEGRWKKPFLSRDKKSKDELIDYIRCMTINQNVDPMVYQAIPPSVIKSVVDYCEESFTATTVKNKSASQSREIMTAEVIYYYMISLGIPFECQKWHLSRLFMLIRVCNDKNSPVKMSKREIIEQNRKLNAARRKKTGSKG